MKIGILKGIKSWLFDKLHDINSYPEDQELRRDIEMYDHLLPHVIALQKRILPAKIKYFFKHEPTFFVKLVLRILLKTLIWLSGIAALGLVIVAVGVLFFHLKINLKAEPIKVDNRELLIYVPNVGVKETDSLNMVFYKSKIKSKAKFVWLYVSTPTKTYDKWANDLCGLESKDWANPYTARRDGSQYWGKYQMGESARKAVKMERYTWVEWQKNPALQEAALRLWVDVLYNDMSDDIKKYDGQFLNGWHITTSGIIAMAHNVGPAPVKTFLHSGGSIVPKDGSGRDATRYLILGGYDLKF